jgi:hypothetical protein
MELNHAANATQASADFEFLITGHQRLVWASLVIAVMALICAIYICCCLYSLRGKLDLVTPHYSNFCCTVIS